MRAARWFVVGFFALSGACDGGEEPVDAGGLDAPEAACAGAADGTPCGSDRICVDGACGASRCGDGYVDVGRGEACDDANEAAFDGCEPVTCQPTCTDSVACDDGIACNGVERCASSRCESGAPPGDGTDCELDGGGAGICRAGACVVAGCGDGVVSGEESCDDGNDVETDGCRTDCRFTCEVDPSMPNTWYLDCDGDGYSAEGAPTQSACLEPPAMACGGGWTLQPPVSGLRDCDDTDADLRPGATETCDGVDQDCDGAIDDGVQTTFYRDADGDTHGDAATTMMACSAPAGFVESDDDCDDGDGQAFPGQTMFFTSPRTSGGFDYDCDGAQTQQHTGTSSLSACSSCACPVGFCCSGVCAGWLSAVPGCGMTSTWRQTDCDCNVVTSSRVQPCR